MGHLSLDLLGSFRANLDGEPVTAFESDKVRALLAYLALEADRPHRREKLAGLLWPDWPASRTGCTRGFRDRDTTVSVESLRPILVALTDPGFQDLRLWPF